MNLHWFERLFDIFFSILKNVMKWLLGGYSGSLSILFARSVFPSQSKLCQGSIFGVFPKHLFSGCCGLQWLQPPSAFKGDPTGEYCFFHGRGEKKITKQQKNHPTPHPSIRRGQPPSRNRSLSALPLHISWSAGTPVLWLGGQSHVKKHFQKYQQKQFYNKFWAWPSSLARFALLPYR